jgi:flagellar FliL protein
VPGYEVLGLLGAGGWGLGWFAPAPASAPAAAPAPVFYALPEFTANLSGGERQSYLRIKVVLEVPDRSVLQALEPQLPRIVDLFQVYLRELRPSDLEGSAGASTVCARSWCAGSISRSRRRASTTCCSRKS